MEREADVDDETVRGILARASRLNLKLRHVTPAYYSALLTEYGIEGYATPSAPERVEWPSPVPAGLGAHAAWHAETRRAFEQALQG